MGRCIDIPENISRGMDLNRDYIVGSHPAVLNGFIDMARKEIRTWKLEEVLGVKNQHITETTRGYEADGHTGTWYVMDMKTYHGERFFQMRNEEYGQDVADIIVSENGTLVQKTSGMDLMKEPGKLFQNIWKKMVQRYMT